MANLAYQVTNFAYQGIGQFAYQGSVDVPPTPAVPDNPTGGGGVRGRQYVQVLSKREEWLERIRLGILPEQLEQAEAAVATAARAETRIDDALKDGDEKEAARQTEEAARELYFEVYKEFMRADEIKRQWQQDLDTHRRNVKRAAATLLLLH